MSPRNFNLSPAIIAGSRQWGCHYSNVSPRNTAMNLHSICISQFRSLRLIAAAFLFLICSISSVRAKSDTDVTIIKAEKVVIEDGVITIIGQARTRVRLISVKLPIKDNGPTWMGRPVSIVTIISDRATFVIKRPELNWSDPDGTHAEEKQKYMKTLNDGWKMSLDAAKELQAGREIGGIGFYAPDISIKGNLIDSIVGYGDLYPKGNEPEG